MLQLYHEHCKNNPHAAEYLLDFMMRHQAYLTGVTADSISDLRAELVDKMVTLAPDDSNKFLLRAFKKYVEELDERGSFRCSLYSGSRVLLDTDEYLCISIGQYLSPIPDRRGIGQ